jgi:hypothetical protein
MNKKILAIVLAVAVVGLYLFMVLYTSSGFNFIPYLIHEAISPGGAGETNFIIVFDVLFAILLFWLAYKLFDRLLKEKK